MLARDLEVLDGLGKLARPGLDFLEQPCVLDGDYGLVGEDLQQIDLSVSERADLAASDCNHADGLACAQRDGQYGSVPDALGTVAALWILISFGLYIGDLNRSPIEHGTPGDTTR